MKTRSGNEKRLAELRDALNGDDDLEDGSEEKNENGSEEKTENGSEEKKVESESETVEPEPKKPKKN
jgi:hypothetical protein